ncbi:MAG: hypothetical protein ACRD51_01850 [Candidatus Acidiferrum sp.]
MRASPKEQRLDALEEEFAPLLILCLKECANGRWGLFGQNQHPEAARYLLWAEADRLKSLAEEITTIRAQFGQPNPNCERFLENCRGQGANLPGEPKRAKKFLKLLGVDW